MANIEIKYIDKYPVYTFGEKFKLPEAALMKYHYDTIKTDRAFKHVYDDFNTFLFSQTIKYEVYVIEDIAGKNLDFYGLQAKNHVHITPEFGDPFWAVNITIEGTNEKGNRDSYFKMTFMRFVEYGYPLSSDYAESLHASGPVNTIAVTVDNPPVSFTQLTMNASGIPTAEYFSFDIGDTNPIFDLLYEIVTLNDWFYLHSNDYDFKSLDIYSCQAISISSKLIRFYTNETTSSLTINHLAKGFVLDFQSDFFEDSNVVDINFTYTIYTFLTPIIDTLISLTEGKRSNDGITENQSINAKELYIFKVWLKTAERWKVEYMNYALSNDVIFTQEGITYKVNVPAQVKGIYKKVDNNSLIDLLEYDIEFNLNNKEVNIYR